MAKNTTQTTGSFRTYLQNTGNTEALQYLAELESAGHKMAVKDGGYIGQIDIDTVYSYDVFASDENKEKYISALNASSSAGVAAVVLAYSVVEGGVHLLIKGDNEGTVKAYVRVVNDLFEKAYNNGEHSIGYPFRPEFTCKQIKGSLAIWRALGMIHGYGQDGKPYPYDSLNYLMRGNTPANLVLGIELDITDAYTFKQKLASKIIPTTPVGKGREKLNTVMEDMRRRYVYPYARVKEDVMGMIIGETCARTAKPYKRVASKMHCYKKRHDLVVTTLCSFMIRRNCTFDKATTLLGLGSENVGNLTIETLAELNRLTHYSYEYIMKKMLCMADPQYDLLVATFVQLNRAYNWNFPEMCEKFHITKDIMYIRSRCNF